MFFKGGELQLKSTEVEFIAYDYLLSLLEPLLAEAEEGAHNYCKQLIEQLKHYIDNGFETYADSGFNVSGPSRETTIKRMFYNWDNEMEIIKKIF
mgnify:FL=1